MIYRGSALPKKLLIYILCLFVASTQIFDISPTWLSGWLTLFTISCFWVWLWQYTCTFCILVQTIQQYVCTHGWHSSCNHFKHFSLGTNMPVILLMFSCVQLCIQTSLSRLSLVEANGLIFSFYHGPFCEGEGLLLWSK